MACMVTLTAYLIPLAEVAPGLGFTTTMVSTGPGFTPYLLDAIKTIAKQTLCQIFKWYKPLFVVYATSVLFGCMIGQEGRQTFHFHSNGLFGKAKQPNGCTSHSQPHRSRSC